MIGRIIAEMHKYRLKAHLKFVKDYTLKGNSYFLDSFRLILNSPTLEKKYLRIGDNTMLNCSITFETNEGEVIIGNNTYIGSSQIICRSRIEVQDNVFIAWGCCIYDHNSHSINYKDREQDIRQQLLDYRAGKGFIENKDWSNVNSRPIRICSNAWIGMNCIIMKGVTIGQGAIVGAGSVVTKDVLPWTIVAGNPAKFIRELPLNLRKE